MGKHKTITMQINAPVISKHINISTYKMNICNVHVLGTSESSKKKQHK